MPRGSRTGPLGRGPRTGRGLGYCAGFPSPGFETPRFGRGFGYGRGDRRDDELRTRWSEKEQLENHIAFLEEELKYAKNELKKL